MKTSLLVVSLLLISSVCCYAVCEPVSLVELQNMERQALFQKICSYQKGHRKEVKITVANQKTDRGYRNPREEACKAEMPKMETFFVKRFGKMTECP